MRGHCRHRLPLRLLKLYARQLCQQYGVPNVSIRVYAVRGNGGQCDQGKIQLDPECGMNGLTLAHELAHHICDVKHPRAQAHGPMFVFYFGCLLSSLRLLPMTAFRAICRKNSVKITRRGLPLELPEVRLPVRPPARKTLNFVYAGTSTPRTGMADQGAFVVLDGGATSAAPPVSCAERAASIVWQKRSRVVVPALQWRELLFGWGLFALQTAPHGPHATLLDDRLRSVVPLQRQRDAL